MIKRIKRSLLLVAILGLTALFFACVGPETSNGNEVTSVLYQSANTPIPDRVNDLVSQMTLEEKVGQMTQVDRQFLVSENHIKKYFLGSLLSGGGSAPSVNTPESWADMTDGYQEKALETRLSIPLIYGIDAVHGHNNVYGATVFPHNIGLGATGDEDLIYRIAAATAEEVRATGIDWNFGPCITVPQDERWGRHYEGFGEEPQLVSRLGAAAITGYQGENLSDSTTILAGA
jgi:beta-glucosidase